MAATIAACIDVLRRHATIEFLMLQCGKNDASCSIDR